GQHFLHWSSPFSRHACTLRASLHRWSLAAGDAFTAFGDNGAHRKESVSLGNSRRWGYRDGAASCCHLRATRIRCLMLTRVLLDEMQHNVTNALSARKLIPCRTRTQISKRRVMGIEH